MINRLHLYRRNFGIRNDKEIEQYIKQNLSPPQGDGSITFASNVDKDRYEVNDIITTLTSDAMSLLPQVLQQVRSIIMGSL